MESIEIQLSEETAKRLRELAEAHNCTLEALIRGLLDRLPESAAAGDPLSGWCADEPHLMDEVLSSAMRSREEHPFRQPSRG